MFILYLQMGLDPFCPFKTVCGCVTSALLLPIFLLMIVMVAIQIYVAVVVSGIGDGVMEYGLQTANDRGNIDWIADIYDLSHDPSKTSEFFDRPESGECCNNMCKGTRCFAGAAFLMRDDHCNECCFKLTTPGSCTDSSCTCYANSQSESNARRRDTRMDRYKQKK